MICTMTRATTSAAATVAFSLAIALAAATPAAANADIDAAVATLATIPGDKAKLDAYCQAVTEIRGVGTDQVKSDIADDRFDAMLNSFGPAFEKVVELSHEFDDASPEGQRLNAGFSAVEANCKF